MTRGLIQAIVPGILWILFVRPALSGQTEKGAIMGTVTDSQGAVIAGATVSVTNQDTNISQTHTTNAQGLYEAPFLTPGLYKVSATFTGFSTSVTNNVMVNVGTRVRTDLTLQIGGVSTQVEVTDRAFLVQAESASVGQVIDNKTLTGLPNVDRNIYKLLVLSSNVAQGLVGNAEFFRVETGGTVTISGMRPSSVTYKIDGLSNTDPTFGTPTVTPSVDSVMEFSLQNNAYSAEFEGIGQVNVATKGGASRFHGTLFDTLLNDALQPRNPIAPRDESGKPGKNPLRWNQFGGTMGGPVWLPGLYQGTDKTFFFFSYEARRSRQIAPSPARVLTAAERAGDFSPNLGDCATVGGRTVPLLNPNGTPSGNCVRAGQIFDPTTTAGNPLFDPNQPRSAFNPEFIRQSFPNNRIPSNRLTRNALALIDLQQPPPNFASAENNYLGTAGAIFDNDQYSVRIDHKFSDRDGVYGRLALQDNVFSRKSPLRFINKDTRGKGRVFNSAWTHVFGPTFVNEFRLGFVRGIYGDAIEEIDPTRFGARNTTLNTLPQIGLLAGGNLFYGGFSGSVLATTQNTYQLADNVSLVRGRHGLKFGFKGEHNRFQNGDRFNANGRAFFNGLYTVANDQAGGTASRPNAMADFLLGLANSESLSVPTLANLRNIPWAVYAQDDWKVTRRMTVNLGLRYEFHQPFREQLLGGARIDPRDGGRLVVADPEVARLTNNPLVVCCTGPHVVETDKNDFGPRMGVAIRPFERDNLVVRAGYGVFYSDMSQFFHWLQWQPLQGKLFDPLASNFLTPTATLDDLFPGGRFTPPGSRVAVGIPSGVSAAALGNRPMILSGGLGSYRTPYSQQWSLSIQREVLPDMLVEIAYTGSNSKNLPLQWVFNQPTPSPLAQNPQSSDPAINPYLRRPFPNFNIGVSAVSNILQANYNAMTMKLDKRFSKGYSILSNYTWSKSIDQGSEVFNLGVQGFALVSNNRDFNQDRGPSNFDATHRWVTSGIVELPLGKGKPFLDRAGWMDKVFGGLQFSGVLRLQSGFPFTPFIRNRLSNTGYGSAWERGDLVGDPYFSDTEWSERVRRWQSGIGRLFVINPSAISLDYAPGTFGNIGRNAFRMPYNRHLELAATKKIRLGEVARLELHAEVFNVTNERLYRFDQINNVRGRDGLTDPNRGSIPEYVFLFNPRVIQLGMRFAF